MKKLIAMAIVLCMVIGMIPMIATAATNYIVAGTADLVNGTNAWDPSNTANQMTANPDGTYSITYENVPAGKHEFKVTDGSWNKCWPGSNYVVNLTETSTVKITFNPTTKAVEATMNGQQVTIPTRVIHAKVPEGWTNANIYAWNDGGPVASWPGEAMTKNGDWFTAEVPAAVTGIIINNGSEQTADIKSGFTPDETTPLWITLGEKVNGKYNATVSASENGSGEDGVVTPELSAEKVTIYAKSSFAAPNLYGWVSKDGTDLVDPGAWPGAPMTQIGTSAWFSMEISKDIANVIINNGSDQQTVDVTLDAAKPYLLVLNEQDEAGHYKVAAFATQAEADAYQAGGENPNPPAGNANDYYLIGYINGADYGCEADSANLGDYKFVEGKVTVNITSDSYVFLKNGDMSVWYMAAGFPGMDATSATLYNTTAEGVFNDTDKKHEKMFVPAGEITFTLVENDDGTLTLSHNGVVDTQPGEGENPGGEDPEGGEIKYVVVGGWEAAGNWTPTDSTAVMSETDGVYSWTGNVAAGDYELKVVRLEGSNATWIPDGMGNNITFTVTADSEITVTYEAAEGVKVDGEKIQWPEEGGDEPITGTYLWGFLNGADYNGTDYKFENGKVTVTFTEKSYVFISIDGAHYMTVNFIDEGTTQGTFLPASDSVKEKMAVPAGTVTFTLTQGVEGSLVLSYTVAGSDPVPPTTTEAPKTTESKPAESKPTESKPAESKPAESKPAESKPAESKPAESKPAESKPAESKPAESKPEESKPAESKPEESKPAESKPEESKPAESKPEESKPEESKPAEVTEITVYAKVPEGWENPGVWAWNDKQENAFEAWPGLAMTQGENGWWYAKVPAWVENVIINANGGSYQTADLDLEQLKADVWVEVTVDANGTAHAELKYTSPATGDETALVSAAAVMLFAAMGVVALVKGKKYF